MSKKSSESFTLHSAFTKESWDDIVILLTPSGKEVEFIRVVRCKDCKYYTLILGNLLNIDTHYGCVHSRGCAEPTTNGYCSHGKRRESE